MCSCCSDDMAPCDVTFAAVRCAVLNLAVVGCNVSPPNQECREQPVSLCLSQSAQPSVLIAPALFHLASPCLWNSPPC